MVKETLLGIDVTLNGFFTSINNDLIFFIMNTLTFLGSTIFAIALTFGVALGLYIEHKKKDSLFYAFTVISGCWIGFIIKRLVERARPENLIESGFSFPSGHTLAATLAYGTLAYILWNRKRKLAYALLALPLVVGFTRIYLGVHWFTDVLAGIFLGAIWIWICVRVFFYTELTKLIE